VISAEADYVMELLREAHWKAFLELEGSDDALLYEDRFDDSWHYELHNVGLPDRSGS
jgi:hypothetical protein